MFDQIATRYDFINRVLALRMDVGWRKRMTQIVQQRIAASKTTTTSPLILDVATGTADVALQLAVDVPDSIILGVDPSVNMLTIGRQKIAHRGLSDRITLVTGDVRDLSSSLSSSSSHINNNNNNKNDNDNDDDTDDEEEEIVLFDAVTMAFGIRNVPEREDALCEIHALLKPGGTIAILEFSEPDDHHGLMGTAARFFIRHIVPVVGALLSGAPREYVHLQNSIKDFPIPTEFRQLMQTVQCGDANGIGTFVMDEVIHMNFGSVQLYVGTALKQSPHDFIQQQIDDHDVVIFSKSYCPHCRAAKSLFRDSIMIDHDDLDLMIHELDQIPYGKTIQSTLHELTGQSTVPNIFVRGHHLGGNDAAQRGYRDGTLSLLLDGPRAHSTDELAS
jgi:demethylmenaquinone methyltransferase/2-methoxy-6-polyprenyl-1,4-benzoquinol methylase